MKYTTSLAVAAALAGEVVFAAPAPAPKPPCGQIADAAAAGTLFSPIFFLFMLIVHAIQHLHSVKVGHIY